MKISTITGEELHDLIKNRGGKCAILLDIRGKEEYEVSHLQGAQWLSPEATKKEIEEVGDKNDIYILYCSVGKRAKDMAVRLMKAGRLHVKCLEGSLFQWVNEGYPVYRDAERVYEVHPFNKKWGKLLDEKYHSQ